MTADILAQVIYANLIEQRLDVGILKGPFGRTSVGDETIDLFSIASAVLKAQSDEAAMARVADPVSVESFDKAVEATGDI